MPRTYKHVAGSRDYIPYTQETLTKCLKEVRSGNLTQTDACLTFKIPLSTIKNKLKGMHNKKPGGCTIFSENEEEIFANYVIFMSSFGFPVDCYDLRSIVKSYADRKGMFIRQFAGNMPGVEWVKSFLKRNKQLSVRFTSNIKRKRAEVGTVIINNFFDNITPELAGVPPSNIWNYDETNLTDDPGNKLVITKRGSKYPERIINLTKSATSLMYCGNAEGHILSPYIVYKADSMWTTWTENGPKGACYNRSKSGWFDSSCFTDWFESLLLPELKKTSGKHVLMGGNLLSHINTYVFV